MSANYGKAFENKFKEDFLKIPDATIDRLYDTTNGFVGIKNISDFIGYKKPLHFYIECKSTEGNTFPISKLRQYDKLVEKVGIPGVRAGVIIWFIDHFKVVYVPISTVTSLKNDNKKSINIKMLSEGLYKIIDIPSARRRIFLDSDYSVLMHTEDGD